MNYLDPTPPAKTISSATANAKWLSLSQSLAVWFILVIASFAVFGIIHQGIRDSLSKETNLAVRFSIESERPNTASSASEVSLKASSKRMVFDKGERVGFTVALPHSLNEQTVFLDFVKSREFAFWTQTNDGKTPLVARSTKQGLIIQIPSRITPSAETHIILEGRAELSSLSRPRAYVVDSVEESVREKKYERNGGFFSGAMISIVVFSMLVAWIARDSAFLVFSAWVLTSLRVALVNGGWSADWFFGILSEPYGDFVSRTLLALHPLITCFLFLSILGPKIGKNGRRLTHFCIISCSVLVMFSLFFRQTEILTILWINSSAAALVLCFLAINSIRGNDSAASRFYVASWLISLAGSVSEVLYVANLLSLKVSPFLNAQSSALIAVVLTACALAERLNVERDAKAIAQGEAIVALEKFEETYRSVPVGLASFSKDGQLIKANPAFVKGFFLSEDFVPDLEYSKKLFELRLNGPVKAFGNRVYTFQSQQTRSTLELIATDISDQKNAEDRLRDAAHRDALTNVYNRFKLIDLLEERLQHDTFESNIVDCITMIDIDAFDRVVTNFGHSVGDAVLLTFKDRIQKKLPETAIFGRLSADTFVAILPDTPLNRAKFLVQSVLDSIHSSPFEAQGLAVNVKARAGVTVIDANNTKEVLYACDSALQDAKEKGGAQLVVYCEQDPAWLAHKMEQQLIAMFTQRIPFERMTILLQPIVMLTNADTEMRYEALIRMSDDLGKSLSPGSFLPALEKIGLMSRLDRWVVNQVFEFLDSHPEHFGKLTYASVNLSGASINDEHFKDDLIALTAKYPHVIRKICFEITESIALADMVSTQTFIAQLRNVGARIALDDFGAGYSSFSYLAQLQVDSIKIDGSLIKDIELDKTKQAIVKTIVDLGKALGSEVVAEWVESYQTLEMIGRLGVDAAQGWALGKPMQLAQMAEARHGAQFIVDDKVADFLCVDSRMKQKIVVSKSIALTAT